MMMAALLMALAFPQTDAAQPQNDRIAKVMAKSDGSTKASAYKVNSVADEYEILRRRHLRPADQALIVEGSRAFDTLGATDPETGAKVTLWFDISSFYGHEF